MPQIMYLFIDIIILCAKRAYIEVIVPHGVRMNLLFNKIALRLRVYTVI